MTAGGQADWLRPGVYVEFDICVHYPGRVMGNEAIVRSWIGMVEAIHGDEILVTFEDPLVRESKPEVFRRRNLRPAP